MNHNEDIYSRRNAIPLKLSSWALSLMDAKGQRALTDIISRGIEDLRAERPREEPEARSTR